MLNISKLEIVLFLMAIMLEAYRLLGWHLCLAQTYRTTRSDYLYTPIRIIRTTDRDYLDSSRRLSEQLIPYLGFLKPELLCFWRYEI